MAENLWITLTKGIYLYQINNKNKANSVEFYWNYLMMSI